MRQRRPSWRYARVWVGSLVADTSLTGCGCSTYGDRPGAWKYRTRAVLSVRSTSRPIPNALVRTNAPMSPAATGEDVVLVSEAMELRRIELVGPNQPSA